MYMPLAWWSQIMLNIDRKIESMAGIYGYGSVSLEIVVRGGVVKDVVLKDEIRVRQDIADPIKDELKEEPLTRQDQ